MDTYEAEGFFPEREVLRARRLRAKVDVPLDPSEAPHPAYGNLGGGVGCSLHAYVRQRRRLRLDHPQVVVGSCSWCAISCVLVGASALAA